MHARVGRSRDIFWVALVAAALAVPAAMAEDAMTAASVKKTAKQALKQAKSAKQAARVAKKRANAALGGLESVETTPGPKGEDGARGPRGNAGPTFGESIGSLTPVENPDFTGRKLGETDLPRAARVLIVASVRMRIECLTGSPTAGLYVDTVPVPGSGKEFSANFSTTELTFIGTTDELSPGVHEFHARANCTGNPSLSSVSLTPSTSIVALG